MNKNNKKITLQQEEFYPETNWESHPTISDLRLEIEAAKPQHEDLINRIMQRRFAISGELNIEIPSNRSKYKSRLIKKLNDWLQSSLEYAILQSKNIIETNQRGARDRKQAEYVKKIINKQMDIDIDSVKFFGEMTRKLTDDAIVFIRTGWEKKKRNIDMIEEVFENVPVTEDPKHMQELIQAVQNGEKDESELYTRVFKEEKEVTVERVVFNGPTLDIVDPENIMFSPIDDETVIVRYEMTKGEMIEAGVYENLDELSPEMFIDNDEEDSDLKDKKKIEENMVMTRMHDAKFKYPVEEFWMKWDINGDNILVPIVVTRVGHVVIRMERNPYPHKQPPFIKIILAPAGRGDVYDEESPMDSIYGNQKVIGAVTRGMIDLMARSANSQKGVQLNAVSPDTRDAFLRGEDYFLNPGIDPNKAFYIHKYPEIPRSASELIGHMVADAESSTGVKSFNTGIGGNTFGDVATNINATIDAVSKRESTILRRIGKGIEKIAYHFLEMSAYELSHDEIVKIVDDDKAVIERDILDQDYNISFAITTPEKEEQKARDIAFMLQTMGNKLPAEQVNILLAQYAKLKHMEELGAAMETYQAPPDPMAQVEMEKEKAITAYYQAMAQLNQVKMQSEIGKAKVLEKDAALRGVNFLDKVEGRDIDKQKEIMDHQFALDLGKTGANAMLGTASKIKEKMRQVQEKHSQTDDSNQDPGMTDAKDIPSEALRR